MNRFWPVHSPNWEGIQFIFLPYYVIRTFLGIVNYRWSFPAFSWDVTSKNIVIAFDNTAKTSNFQNCVYEYSVVIWSFVSNIRHNDHFPTSDLYISIYFAFAIDI